MCDILSSGEILVLALWVSGGASTNAPWQWRWAQPDSGQTCSGPLATPLTTDKRDNWWGCVHIADTIRLMYTSSHKDCRSTLRSENASLLDQAVYENLCHRFVAIWQLSRWNPIYRGFAFKFLSQCQGQAAVTVSQLPSSMKLIQESSWPITETKQYPLQYWNGEICIQFEGTNAQSAVQSMFFIFHSNYLDHLSEKYVTAKEEVGWFGS